MPGTSISPRTVERISCLMLQAGIREQDLREQFVLGGGRGGQKLQKTSSCVRLFHEPSRINIRCQATRSREINRWLARRLLAEQLLARLDQENSRHRQKIERIRRQKRRRTRRMKERVLTAKRMRGELKRLRSDVVY